MAPPFLEELNALRLAYKHDPHGARVQARGEIPPVNAKHCIAVRRGLTATAGHAHAECPPFAGVSCGIRMVMSVHHLPTRSKMCQKMCV
jgi:hypothetical protein